jgi:hypothetical protein
MEAATVRKRSALLHLDCIERSSDLLNSTLRYRSSQLRSLSVESPCAGKWIVLFGHCAFELTLLPHAHTAAPAPPAI